MTPEAWAQVALGYVLENQNWSTFIAWIRDQPHSSTIDAFIRNGAEDIKALLQRNYLATTSRMIRD